MASGRSRTAAPRRLEPPGRPWLQPLVVFAAAAAVRIAVAASLWNLPLVRTPKLDSAEYLSWARRLASGDWTWPAAPQHGPGYPLFLAALLSAGSDSIAFAMVGQALLGACTAVVISLIARRSFGERAGLFAGLAYAVYGPAAYVDTAILGEGLLLFLLSVGLLLTVRLKPDATYEGESVRRAAVAALGAGIACGAAAVVRPTALLIAAACGAGLALTNRRDRLRATLAFAAGVTIAIAPALAKSWTTSGSPGIQGYGGLNVYIGNSPLHDGRATFRLGGGWDALNAEASRAGVDGAAAQDRYYLSRTWREIADRPGAFVSLLASKTVWLLQAEEARDSHSYYFFAEQSPLLRVLPRFALLLPLACVGLVAAAARLKPRAPTVGGAVPVGQRRPSECEAERLERRAPTVRRAVPVGQRRPSEREAERLERRAPPVGGAVPVGQRRSSEREALAEPRVDAGARKLQPSVSLLLFYLAGAAVSVVLLVVGFRYRMPLVPVLAVLAGAGVDAIVTALRARQTTALAVYASAIVAAVLVSHVASDARNRNTAEEWAFTGSALVTERNLADAEAAYREAIARDPRSGLAWDGLGLTLYNGGRLAEARGALAEALAIDPDSSRALFHRALVDERDGKMADAADGYRRALELSPFDVDAARHLGDALLALERPGDAVAPLRLAASQAPRDGEAQRKLAIALGMSNRTAEARDAIRRAVDVMPGNGEAWLDLCLLSLDLKDADGAAVALQRARQLGADPNRLAFADAALARARQP